MKKFSNVEAALMGAATIACQAPNAFRDAAKEVPDRFTLSIDDPQSVKYFVLKNLDTPINEVRKEFEEMRKGVFANEESMRTHVRQAFTRDYIANDERMSKHFRTLLNMGMSEEDAVHRIQEDIVIASFTRQIGMDDKFLKVLEIAQSLKKYADPLDAKIAIARVFVTNEVSKEEEHYYHLVMYALHGQKGLDMLGGSLKINQDGQRSR